MLGLVAIAALVAMSARPNYAIRFPSPDSFEISLGNEKILEARLEGLNGTARDAVQISDSQQPAEPMYLGYPHGPKTADWAPLDAQKRMLTLNVRGSYSALVGTVFGTREAFACSDDPATPLISTFGAASSSLENGVYDRSDDWLITSPGARVHTEKPGRFRIQVAAGAPVQILTDFYRDHRGYFLWDKGRKLWSKPVAGWCSWAAYGQQVTEDEVAKAAEFFGAKLKDYGYSVIQIDDGYQRVLQLTEQHQHIDEPFADYWTKANGQFPSGMKAMAEKIASFGLIPGVWVGLYLPLGLKHADGYVTGPDGKPLKGPWVGYSMDSGDSAAVAEAYTNTLAAFREEGWRYFKIDTLRHVLYDSYRRVPEYWAARHTDSTAAYRKLFEKVRNAVGKDDYLLACWGALPELAGIPDGCRIGEDVGPDVASMRRTAKYIAQFHYANDVIWRNDPDYMCFRVPVAQCQTWATMNTMAGGHVMVSDPIETYDAERTEILRRVGPSLVTRPGNVVPHSPDPEWQLLSAEKGGDKWTVAARLAWKPLEAEDVPVSKLGLEPVKDYLAFDFWAGKFLGVVHDRVPFKSLGDGGCQVVSLRPATGVPQVLGDDRHIGQGAVELDGVQWRNGELSGRFLATPDHAWKLFVYVPEGWRLADGQSASPSADPRVIALTIPAGSGWQKWHFAFVAER